MIDPVEHALDLEIGTRALQFLEIENSNWAYHLWFMTGKYWWDASDNRWVTETRPEILAFCKGIL